MIIKNISSNSYYSTNLGLEDHALRYLKKNAAKYDTPALHTNAILFPLFPILGLQISKCKKNL